MTLKEKRRIKEFLKKIDRYSKPAKDSLLIAYKVAKKIPLQNVIHELETRIIPERNIEVKSVQAYEDLITSWRTMKNYEGKVAEKGTIIYNGTVVEEGTKTYADDLTGAFWEAEVSHAKTLVNVYKDYKNCSDELTKLIMISYINLLHNMLNSRKDVKEVSCEVRAEEVRQAEEKYGVKFFVKDYLYDTFMNPQMFVSYGIRKVEQEKTHIA